MIAERLRLLLPKVLHTDLPHRRGVAPGQLCGTELGPETPGPGLLKVPERPVKSITDALLDTYRYILAYPIRYKFIFIFISIDTLYIFSRAREPERAHSNVFSHSSDTSASFGCSTAYDSSGRATPLTSLMTPTASLRTLPVSITQPELPKQNTHTQEKPSQGH